MLNTVSVYCFSPTGGTRKIAEELGRGLSQTPLMKDLFKDGGEDASDVIVVAVPVFGGRIPAPAAERIAALKASGKKAVTAVVYGNRAYDDALLELNRLLEEQGCTVAASCAFVAQHSIVPEVAAGRPDADDLAQVRAFAAAVLEKLEHPVTGSVNVPGSFPYRAQMKVMAAPVSGPQCVKCGCCAQVCPTGAISQKDGAMVTELEKCMLCMACVHACPLHARALLPMMQEKSNAALSPLKNIRRENETFL